jgi:transcriptional regulator
MHPNRAFHVADDEEALALAHRIGLAHIFLTDGDGAPMVAHAPVVRTGARALRFHLARANRVIRHLDGARVLLSLVGAHGYVTPSWYEPPGDQVPTWNYVGVEIEGRARILEEPGLIEQLDQLAAQHEPGLSPRPWTRDKMAPARFAAMLKAIIGFEVTVETVRSTIKLSQNKPDKDRAGVIAGLDAAGNHVLARAMRGGA